MPVYNQERLKRILLSRIVVKDGPLDTPCWVWTWGQSNGYGSLRWNRRMGHAHRFSYAAFVGPVPDNLDCLHHCDVRRCIRPDHLYLGTDQDNADDKYRRGRDNHAFGEGNGSAVLTNRQAGEVKWLALQGFYTQEEIADRYGIGHSEVSRIKFGKTFRHVEPIEPPPQPIPLPTPGFVRRI